MLMFKLFGFPVRVHWTFFVLAAFLGMRQQDTVLILIWIAVVFVGILIHELGHATLARYYGLDPSITLYSMGGLTSWQSYRQLTNLQTMAISFAGPLAGFLAGGIVLWSLRYLPPDPSIYLRYAIGDWLWVNFGWGLINLVPVLPLDGGQIMRSAVHAVRRSRDERLPRMISIVFGCGLILLAVTNQFYFGAVIAGMITYSNVAALRSPGARPGI
jgi:membrane-associated protease RseP (regulator of RpoE activity)